MRRIGWQGAVLGGGLLLALAACGGPRTYLIGLQYQPAAPAEQQPGPLPSIAVNFFTDVRERPDRVKIGTLTDPRGETDTLIPARLGVDEVVTQAIADALAKRGHPVKQIQGWDLTPAGVQPAWGDVLVGGQIQDFWITGERALVNTRTAAAVRLKVVAVASRTREVLYEGTLSTSAESTEVFFSEEQVAATASKALSRALDLFLTNPQFLSRLQAVRP
jgi:hypothetical protein